MRKTPLELLLKGMIKQWQRNAKRPNRHSMLTEGLDQSQASRQLHEHSSKRGRINRPWLLIVERKSQYHSLRAHVSDEALSRSRSRISKVIINGSSIHFGLLVLRAMIILESPPASSSTKPSFNDAWAQFQQLLRSIFHKQELKMSLQQAYEVRKDLRSHGDGPLMKMYSRNALPYATVKRRRSSIADWSKNSSSISSKWLFCCRKSTGNQGIWGHQWE